MHDVSFGGQWSQFAGLSFTAYVAAFSVAALAAFATTPYTRRITDPDTRRGLVALLVASGGWATSHVGFLLVTTPLAKKMFYVGGLIVPAAVALFKADSPDDMVGRPLSDWMMPASPSSTLQTRMDSIEQGRPVSPHEHTIPRRDGTSRTVESYAVSIDYQGEDAAQVILRDITERKRRQQQLQQAQRMETVGTLAGGIAHDFNNILHTVEASVEMVRQNLPDEGTDRVLLGNAEDGLHRAADLVQQLLAFSRNDATATVERTDVGTVVREAVRLVRPSLPASVELTTEVDDGCWILGDSAQIHQVVTNLLTNAGQAMEEDHSRPEHRLSVDLRLLDVSGDQARRHLGLEPGRYVRLSVRDTGPGMDGATQDRIFEPFFSTKEAGSQKGTGLGLAVTHGIVQSHDGEVVVASEVGEGTTFDVYLPGASVPSEAVDPPLPCAWSDGRPVVAASTTRGSSG